MNAVLQANIWLEMVLPWAVFFVVLIAFSMFGAWMLMRVMEAISIVLWENRRR